MPTYVLLKDLSQKAAFEEKFPETINKPMYDAGFDKKSSYYLFPITDYHFKSLYVPDIIEGTSKREYSYILMGIGFLVLVIACFNYMNLSIATASTRIKEIGMRKVFGAARRQLIRQFWFESLVMSLLSCGVGILLAQLFLPLFNNFAQKSLRFGYFNDLFPWIVLLAVAFFVGILSGSYPAFILSRFQSVDLFRGRVKLSKKNVFSRFLIIFQFSISIFLILATILLYKQNRFLLDRNLGFESDRMVVLSLKNVSDELHRTGSLYPVLKERLLKLGGVRSVAGANYSLTDFWAAMGPRVLNEDEKRSILDINYVDHDFVNTLGISLVEGRNFSPNFPADAREAAIVNEAFVKRFELENPVGRSFSEILLDAVRYRIIGVAGDYHYQSLHKKIRPCFLLLSEENKFRYVYVRIAGADTRGILDGIKREFHEVLPEVPFEYAFLDEEVARQYTLERRWELMIKYATGLAILIACSGLFALTYLTVMRRTKEIGVRRVLGASVYQITRLINREFILLVLAANVISWPLSYLAMNKFLQNYPYRISPAVWMFLLAGFLAFVIAVLTVSLHALRIGGSDPVEAIRYE
jgi:putative ABC transport system permease protein